jgi:hypothetical protein
MSAATVIGVFLVPVLFVVVERLGKKKATVAAPVEAPAKGGAD